MIGAGGFMAAPKQPEQAQHPVWGVEWCSTYQGRSYWTVWRHQAGVYGGRAYLMTPSRTDRKRFYDQAKAEAAAEALNRAPTPSAAGQADGSGEMGGE